MGKIINVGIIGQGRSGRNIHGEYLKSIPRKFRVTAVADSLADRRQRAIKEYGCEAYASWKGLLKRDDLDLIVNASPTQQHVPLTVACLKAGFNVLSEKPLARKVSEVDKVIRAAKKARRLAAVFQNNRYSPIFQKVKQVIDSGVLGRIVLIKGQASNFKRRWDWQTLRKNYGGNLLNTGSHQLDQLLQLFGTDVMPDVMCTMDRTETYGDAEDHVKMLLRKQGRPTIDFEVSSCCVYQGPPFNVYGTRGGLKAADNMVEWKYYNPAKQPKRRLMTGALSDAKGIPAYCGEQLKWQEKSWKYTGGNPFDETRVAFYDMLYNTMTKRTRLGVTMQEIRQQVAVIEECHRQNPPGRMPKAKM